MGQGRTYKCKQCEYIFEEITGIGYFYPSYEREMYEKARLGELGEILKDFLAEHDDGSVSFAKVSLCCDACGNLECGSDYSMEWAVGENEVKHMDYPHKCSKCGGKMHIVDLKEKRLCPHCKMPMEVVNLMCWD